MVKVTSAGSGWNVNKIFYYGERIPWHMIHYDIVTKKDVEYINLPCAFDIETSSFYEGPLPRAIMYHWQFCIGEDLVIMGRTWQEWHDFIIDLRRHFKTYLKRILVIFVHNLAYEFTWIRKRLKWDSVFNMDSRKPLYARSMDGIEFRCSYLLSGYNLAVLGNNLQWHDVRKSTGDLDYSKVRNSKSYLSPAEIGYCVNDVKVISAYIAERIKADGDITKLPYTKTGYVRNDCRAAVYGANHRDKQSKNYRGLMKMLTIAPDEYMLLREAFQGGFTHANVWYVNETLNNVVSKDFTSSYPTVMVAEKYPMSRGVPCKPSGSEYMEKENLYCWLLDIEFANIYARIIFENYISLSRCTKISSDYDVNNGRVVRASYLRTTITEQDFKIIRKAYKCDAWHIIRAYRYKKAYLPKRLVLKILGYYSGKTTLKDVIGKEAEYLEGKERLNCIYGMCVTDPLRDQVEYNEDSGEWEKCAADPEAIEKENKNRKRFLFYPWGVWVTAYARRNLWLGILECGTDYVYSDTDSVKYINAADHEKWFDQYDKWIIKRLEAACKYHNISPDKIAPKTIEGIKKPLGVWDADGHYGRFKTLGAKRYMTESVKNGVFSLTVSGLNKKKAIPYLLEKYGSEGIFDAFRASEPGGNKGLIVPRGHSGRQILTYIDHYTSGVVYDDQGIAAEYEELTSVHMEEGTYEINFGKEFFEYLQGFKEVQL